eukprot:Nitzschia sp. Nitz4//scaffold88_size82704//33164//34444//NITZ4_005290-RA/size82704-processed-gene-0.66-mRNA-1//-1//CDS//3329559488//5059//frame0
MILSPKRIRSSRFLSTTVTTPDFETDVCVIGAGAVGLAIARALSMAGKEVILVDKAPHISSETSSRNSEVIHAGLYYPPDSLKAKFCVKGKHMLYDYCRERHVPVQQCGKLIVATHPNQIEAADPSIPSALQALQQRAFDNRVEDVEILSQEQVEQMEPEVLCYGALWSPSTGVLDSHTYYTHLLADAEENGTMLALNTQVATTDSPLIQGEDGVLRLRFEDGTQLACQSVVNAAGLGAGRLAKAFHSSLHTSSDWTPPDYFFAKGTYFQLQPHANPAGDIPQRKPFSHLIYPVPEPGGLGVHATLDWGGQTIKFGPDVEWIDPDVEDPALIDLAPNPDRAHRFFLEVQKYWPSITEESLIPDYAGIRPKLNHPAVGPVAFEDFRIIDSSTHGVPGLIHLLGIESPGLTSSMAIAEYVASLVQKGD